VTTILVTGACGPAGHALGIQLREHSRRNADLVVIGADANPQCTDTFPVLVGLPVVNSPSYIPELLSLVERFEVDLVIPTVSEELTEIAELTDLLTPTTRVLVSSAQAARVCSDKWLTMQALDHAGVAIPRFALASSFHSTAEAMHALGGPVIVKPRVSRGGRNVMLIENPDSLWHPFDESWLVQQFAPGTEYCPQIYAEPSANEESDHTVIVLEKLGLKGGRIGNATATTRLRALDAGDVFWLAHRATDALHLRGPIDMDIRRTADGQPVVLEVNARFGANSEAAPELLERSLTSVTELVR